MSRRARLLPKQPASEVHAGVHFAAYARLPIGRLPIRIFTNILYLVLLLEPGWSASTLAMVSPVWSHIVLATPRLRSFLRYPMTKKDVQESVKKAGNHPLSVLLSPKEGNGCRKTMRAFMKEVGKHVRNWRELELNISHVNYLDLLPASGEYDGASVLERCTLRVQNRWPLPCRIHLFAGNTPKLRHLTLSGVNLPWKSPIFFNLRTLSISNVPEMVPSATISTILTILSQCRTLTELELEFAIGDSSLGTVLPQSSDFRATVALDELETLILNLDCDRGVFVTFLSNIRLPPSTQVFIKTRKSFGRRPPPSPTRAASSPCTGHKPRFTNAHIFNMELLPSHGLLVAQPFHAALQFRNQGPRSPRVDPLNSGPVPIRASPSADYIMFQSYGSQDAGRLERLSATWVVATSRRLHGLHSYTKPDFHHPSESDRPIIWIPQYNAQYSAIDSFMVSQPRTSLFMKF